MSLSSEPIELHDAHVREWEAYTERETMAGKKRIWLLEQDINVAGALALADLIPDTEYVQRPGLVQGQLLTLTGHNGHGKSTLAAAMWFLQGTQRPLGPLQPNRAGLSYFGSAEDIAGTRLRIYAEAIRHELSPGERAAVDRRLRWIHINSQVHPSRIAEAIHKDCGPTVVTSIFLDTGPAMFPGDDENDNTQQQRFAAACRILTELPGAPCVVLLWHPAKSATRDNLIPRGGSSLIGTVDANLTVWREDDVVTLGYTKLRSEHFEPMKFALEPVDLILPSGATARIPVAVPLADESFEQRDSSARRRREALLLALDSAEQPSLRDLATRAGAGKSTIARDLEEMSTGRGAMVEQDRVSRAFRLTAAGKRAARELRDRDGAAYRHASDPD